MHDEAIEHFLDEGLIERVIRPIKSGKEASVHLCRANPRTTGEELAALKIYHPLDRRDFRDESIYRDGEFIKERRIRVALDKRTRFGREVQGGIWVSREWETLHALFAAGAPVPRPIEATDRAILMSYIGDEDDAAPAAPSVSAQRSRGSRGAARAVHPRGRADALPRRGPRRPLSVQRARVGGADLRDRPPAGRRSEEESARRVAPGARCRAHLRALRSPRGRPEIR